MFEAPWTFASGEAGDTSFRFDRGATRHFVVAIIGTQQPEALRQALAELRQRRNLPANYEFSFHWTTARQLRTVLFETVAGLDFRVWAVVAEKAKLHDSFRIMPGRSLYVYFITEVIQLIPVAWREGTTLLLDQFDEAGKAITALKQGLKARGIPKGFKRIRSKRSRGEDLIQIADLMAGAILRKYAKGDARAYQVVEPKIASLLSTTKNRPASSSSVA